MGNIGRADQSDQSITNILTLDQNENDEDDNQEGRCNRAEQRADKFRYRLQGSADGLMHFDREGRSRSGGLPLANLLAKIFDNLFCSLKGRSCSGFPAATETLNFGGNRRFVLRQIASEVCHLASHHRTKRKDRAEG